MNNNFLSETNKKDLFEDLFYLACAGKEDDLDYLIDENPKDINRKCKEASGGTILHAFIEEGNVHVVEKLIAAGARVNKTDKRGETPLHRVTANRHIENYEKLEIVEKLIKAGANVNIKDNKGNTPLLEAAENSSVEVVKKLITAGARVNDKIISNVNSVIEELSHGHEGGRIRRREQEMIDKYTEILELLLKGKGRGGGRRVTAKKRRT